MEIKRAEQETPSLQPLLFLSATQSDLLFVSSYYLSPVTKRKQAKKAAARDFLIALIAISFLCNPDAERFEGTFLCPQNLGIIRDAHWLLLLPSRRKSKPETS